MAPEVAIMTTAGAARDNKAGIYDHDGSRFSVDEYDILLHAQKRHHDIPKLGLNWDDAGITDPALTQLNSGYGVFIGQIFNT